MALTDQESELFDRWRPSRPGFVLDGVVDQESYATTSPSILLVLKEVNDQKSPGGWDLRRFVSDGARPATWDNAARWVRGIRSLPDHIGWSILRPVSKELRAATLKSVAVMNLKKSPGTHTTDVHAFWNVVKSDRLLLREQFELYRADLVICCGSVVAAGIDHVLDGLATTSKSWAATSRGVRYREYCPGRFLVAYAHPEARVAENLLCYGLIDAVREIRERARALS